MAEVGVGEELEGSTAGAAFEIMLHLACGPLIAEEVLQRTGGLGDAQFAFIDGIEEAASEFEIFTRLFEAEAVHEPVALRACRHWISVPSSRSWGSHADGASVMLTLRHGTVIWSIENGSDWHEESQSRDEWNRQFV